MFGGIEDLNLGGGPFWGDVWAWDEGLAEGGRPGESYGFDENYNSTSFSCFGIIFP